MVDIWLIYGFWIWLIHPLVPSGFIKHGWLENQENHRTKWSIFQHAIFDSRGGRNDSIGWRIYDETKLPCGHLCDTANWNINEHHTF